MPPNPNAGPDFSTFGGAGAAGGGIVGTNQLQTAIDKFTQAVDKLSTVASSSGAAGSGLSAGTFPRPANPFVAPAMSGAPAEAAAPTGPSAPFPRPVNPFVNPAMPVGATAPATRPTSTVPPMTPTGGGGGGAAPPAAAAGAAASGMGGATAAVGAAAAIGGVLGAIGGSTKQAQLGLNTLQYQTAMGGASYATTAANALGTVGNRWGSPTKTNQWAFNAPDALQGYSLLQQASANANPYSTAGGRNVLGAMGAANIANPAASETQNAGMLANLYNPQTSMNMMMRGYPNTPLQQGTGKQQPLPNVLQPFISQATKSGTTSLSQFNTTLTPGQPGYTTLQNLFPGMTADQLSQIASTSQMEYALGSGQKVGGAKGAAPKMSMAQINQLMGTQGLASQDAGQVKKAEATLGKYGFKQSDYQAIKAAAAPGEQAVSTTSGAYTKGLQQNTQMLKTLNSTLQKLVNSIPGAKGVVGWAEGFLGGGSPLTNLIGGGAMVHGTGSSPVAQTGGGKHSAQSAMPNSKASTAVKLAETQIGVPYTYGLEAPGKGFDCSALPQWAYNMAGVHLPRTAAQQYAALKNDLISPSQATTGDLVFSAGAGAGMHEAMMVDNTHVIEAKGVGSRIAVTSYNPRDWKYAARPATGTTAPSKNKSGKVSKTNVVGGGGSGSGPQVAAYAKTFATGLNHPYALGGQGPGGWDCSGFSAYVYEHFGYFPGGQKSRYGTSESQFASPLLQSSGAQPGALVFFNDGIFANPGHVGVMVSGSTYAGADSTAVGTVIGGIAGNVGFRIPKGGFNGKGGAPAGGGSMSAAAAAAGAALAGLTAPGANAKSGLGTPGPGSGDTSSEGSVEEKSSFSGALNSAPTPGGGATTASATTQANQKALAAALTSMASGGGSAGGAAVPGGTTANLTGNKAIMNKAAAAHGWGTGAEWSALNALEMQEAGYNNLAQNPTSTAYGMGQFLNTTWAPYGPKTSDPTLQAKYMMSYIHDRWGDPIKAEAHEMASHWYAAGGLAKAGTTAWVGERGPELVSFTKDATVHHASDSARLMKSSMAQPAQGPWAAGAGASYNYSQMHSAYSGFGTAHGAGGANGLTINCNITMNGSAAPSSPTAPPAGTGAAGMSVTGYEGAAAAQAFAKQLKIELAKLNLQNAIGTGVTS